VNETKDETIARLRAERDAAEKRAEEAEGRSDAPAFDDAAAHGLLEWMRVVDGCAADMLTTAGIPPEKLAALARAYLASREREREALDEIAQLGAAYNEARAELDAAQERP